MKKLLIIFIIAVAIVAGLLLFNSQNNKPTFAAAPRTGLVGYWTMDSNDVNGTSYYDRSGLGLTLTAANSPTVVSGKIKQSVKFNGSTQKLSATSNSTLDNLSTMTVAVWINPSSYPSGNGGTLLTHEVNYSFYTELNSSGNIQVYLQGTLPAAYHAGAIKIPLKSWSHVAWTFVGSTLSIYVNGVLDSTFSVTGSLATGSGTITMGRLTTPNYEYNGAEDDVRIYNYALSAQDVANLFNASARSFTAAPVRASSTPGGGGRLVGYWTMDQNDIRYAGTATTTYDRSGFNNIGTFSIGANTYGATSTPGVIKQAIAFDGVDDKITTSAFTIPIYPMTLSAWVKPVSLGTYGIVGYGNTNAGGQANEILEVGGSFWAMSISNTSVEATAAVNTGVWQHLVGVFSSATSRKIYINGVFQNEDTTSKTPTPTSPFLTIGNRVNGANQPMNGSIDDVRIYNYALSAQDVANLYQSAARNYVSAPVRTGPSGQLVGYWTLDSNDINGTKVYDKSGLNNTGTSANTPTIVAGKIKQAMSFNGTSDFIQLNNPSILQPANITVAMWIKTATSTASVLRKYNGGYALEIGDPTSPCNGSHLGEIKFWIYNGSAFYCAISSGTINNNQWHHVAGSYDGNNIKIYVDGQLSNSTSIVSSINYLAGNILLGESAAANQFFSGSLDDARIYNYALSAQDVANLYKAAARSYR